MELTVWAHDPADPEVYVDPGLLHATEGAVAELWVPAAEEFGAGDPRRSSTGPRASIGSRATSTSSAQSGQSQRKNMYFHITRPALAPPTKLATISVSSAVLQTLGIQPRSSVRVHVLKPHQLRRTELDVVEIHFKGVHLTRNDHYRVAKELNGRCVYSGQRVSYLNDSVRLTVETLFRGGRKKFSGTIGENSRVVFRSDSAHILIFIHMAEEMWNFDETGDIMFHKLVNSFLPEMLHKWHTQGDLHLVSLVLFTSVRTQDGSGSLASGVLAKNTCNFYRVVVDSTSISRWSDIMGILRTEFERFPRDVLEDPESRQIRGQVLPSSKSNVLEALSLATTLLTSKFVDRDMCRTGAQAMVVTAGQACFDVDLKDLHELSRRLLGVEIGIELVCLARPPLHITPMFRALLNNEDENRSVQPYRLVFVVPKWINMSFWSSLDRYRQQWIPRCRIYDLQMVGLIENEAKSLGLKSFGFDPSEMNSHFMRRFDNSVFKSVEMIESQKRIEQAAQAATSLELKPRQNNLQNRETAMAITTRAVAPAVTSPSPQETPHTASIDIPRSRGSLPTTNAPQNAAPKLPKLSAKASLGALLGTKSPLRDTEASTAAAATAAAAAAAAMGGNSLTMFENESTAFENDALIHINRDATDSEIVEDGIFVPTPAHLERRGSKQFKPRSPSARWSGPPPPIKNSASPEREKKLSRSPKSLAVPMCDTSRPELDNTSMWRVLPNPATIDDPSRVMAYGRWANVYPPKKRLNGVSWHSLNSPASLPLTCESFTSLQSFKERYNFQFYDVAVDNDEISLSQLLDEMIGLRLQMGFQIAVGPNTRAIEASLPRGNPNRVVEIVPKETKDCIGIRIYMTRVALIHRLAVDDDRLINVRLYSAIERNTKRLTCPVNFDRREEVKVKTRFSDEYQDINKSIFDQDVQRLNWSMLDQQVSGADDPLLYPSSANTQNLVTIRYVVVPAEAKNVPGNETLTAEETHVEGITKLVRMLLRHREAGSIDSDFIVHFYTGKLTKAIKEVAMEPNNSLEVNRLNKSISLRDIAAEMQGPMGIPFRDRRWHWKYFRQVFTGHDFVIWVLKTFEDISTPEDAEQYGANLMQQGLFRHPEDRHPFIQGHYFYALTPQYSQTSDSSSLNSDESPSSSDIGSAANSRSGTPMPESSEPRESNGKSSGEGSKALVHISESFVINVDPRRISGRPERVKVSIDRLHNPKNAFHIIVEWLSVTPKLVDNLFTSMGRMASQYGLRLVQLPLVDVVGSIELSPFRSPLKLRFDVQTADAEEYYRFRHFALLKCGYCLDIHDRRYITNSEYEVLFLWGKLRSSAPQYVHNSGYVLVQVGDDRTLNIVANTLHVSRAVLSGNASSGADSEAELLMDQLQALCTDKSRLEEMLVEARQFWHQKRGSQRATHNVKREA